MTLHRPALRALPTVAFLAGVWCFLVLTLPWSYFSTSTKFRHVGNPDVVIVALGIVTFLKGLYLTIGLPQRLVSPVHAAVTAFWVGFAGLLFTSALPLSAGFAAIVCWCSYVVFVREAHG